jgi:hypothetical protein
MVATSCTILQPKHYGDTEQITPFILKKFNRSLSLASAVAQGNVVRAIMHFKGKSSFLTPI